MLGAHIEGRHLPSTNLTSSTNKRARRAGPQSSCKELCGSSFIRSVVSLSVAYCFFASMTVLAQLTWSPLTPAHIYCDVYVDVDFSFFVEHGSGMTQVCALAYQLSCVLFYIAETIYVAMKYMTCLSCLAFTVVARHLLPSSCLIGQDERVGSAASKVLSIFNDVSAIYAANFPTSLGVALAGITVCRHV
jgi:hypothetical protein